MRFGDARLRLADDQRLGFGRVNAEPGGSKGWGYDGRFLELGPETYIHRIWGDLVWQQGLWHVRSLGSRHPLVVAPEGHRAIELPARDPDGEPHQFAVTQRSFEVVAVVGSATFRLECSATDATAVGDPSPVAGSGSATVTFGDELASNITATEFRVLWVMAREYRAVPRRTEPQPLSYSRICRVLGLTTEKQASGAVERMMGRFRELGLVPVELETSQQRDWLCRESVRHGALDSLCLRHGTPEVD